MHALQLLAFFAVVSFITVSARRPLDVYPRERPNPRHLTSQPTPKPEGRGSAHADVNARAYDGHRHGQAHSASTAYGGEAPIVKSYGQAYGHASGRYGADVYGSSRAAAGLYYPNAHIHPNVVGGQSAYGSANGRGPVHATVYVHGATKATPHGSSASNSLSANADGDNTVGVTVYGRSDSQG